MEEKSTRHSHIPKKSVAFFSPYIPNHFGGGEKHFFDIATCIAQDYEVYICITRFDSTQEQTIKTSYQDFLGYSLEKLRFIDTPLGTSAWSLSKIWWTQQFEYMYYVTDGSIYISLARYNNIHIQVPFTNRISAFEKWKLGFWHSKNTNSFFTKYQIEKAWNIPITTVAHPMVDIEQFTTLQSKEKKIISVGRFFQSLHSKRQDVLIEVFTRLLAEYPQDMNGFRLCLIGTVEDQKYFESLQQLAQDAPIEFVTHCSRQELQSHIKESLLYWHATGYQVDEDAHPDQVEHFGIATIEAMAGGCVPLVVGKGGQKEIMGEELAWCLWESIEECMQKTVALIRDQNLLVELRQQAKNRVLRYSRYAFEASVHEMFPDFHSTHPLTQPVIE